MPDDTPKRCCKCKQYFPRTSDHWHKNKSQRDGLQGVCKQCNTISLREWRAKNPEKRKEQGRRDYWRDPERRRKLSRDYVARNKETAYAKRRARRAADPKKYKEFERKSAAKHRARRNEYISKWRKANPLKNKEYHSKRRAAKLAAGGVFTDKDLKLIFKSQKGKCWWCGKKLKGIYHADHRIPLSKGGTNYPNNIVLACPKCNLSKHDSLPDEWAGRLL